MTPLTITDSKNMIEKDLQKKGLAPDKIAAIMACIPEGYTKLDKLTAEEVKMEDPPPTNTPGNMALWFIQGLLDMGLRPEEIREVVISGGEESPIRGFFKRDDELLGTILAGETTVVSPAGIFYNSNTQAIILLLSVAFTLLYASVS